MRILHVGDDFAALRPCGLTLYADALMQWQVAAGHEVAYVFSGRHYPRLPRPRLKRWTDRGVRMLELVNSPIHSHWEAGTRRPALDLAEPAGEAAFAAALSAARPDVVHVQELSRLPSSVIELAKAAGVPVVMSLHDYKPVCASVRLLDADGARCLRHDVGADCARNCAYAPDGPGHLINWTLDYELARAKRAVPLARRIDFLRIQPVVTAAKRLLDGPSSEAGHEPVAAGAAAQPADYQRRREQNLDRLNLCDRLVAPSDRAADVYAELGVERERLRALRLTLPHLEELTPSRPPGAGEPLTFVVPGGCASPAKGSRVVTEAVLELERSGHDYRLLVLGHVDDEALGALAPLPRVSLHGRYDPADLGRLLDSADVGIVPSTWEETHGFVGIELLAKGLPVIGSALGGIPEYVRDGETGWLNRSAGGAELARHMRDAISAPDRVVALQQAVRERRGELVRPFAPHAMEMEALYAELGAQA